MKPLGKSRIKRSAPQNSPGFQELQDAWPIGDTSGKPRKGKAGSDWLSDIYVRRQLRAPAPSPKRENTAPALLWMERNFDVARDLKKNWGRIEAQAIDCMLDLLNVPDLGNFRKLISPMYDIAEESDFELTELRNQLRTVWAELATEWTPDKTTKYRSGENGDDVKVSTIFYKWRNRYGFDSDGWRLIPEAGVMFPTGRNFRGLILRIVFDKRRYLAICPTCGAYFIKRRDDQKNCLSGSCLRQANKKRQQDFQQRVKGKKS